MAELVRVTHPDIEGEALVPETALRQMTGWRRVEDDDQPDDGGFLPERTETDKDD